MRWNVVWGRIRNPFFLFLSVLVAVTANANAASETYERGEFRFGVGPTPAFVLERKPADAWDSAAPGANGAHWRNWLIDAQSDRRGGKRVRYVDLVYEAVSSEMTREAGKVQIWFNPEFQQLEIHRVAIRRAGKWFDRLVPESVTLARRESQFEQDMATGMVSALLVMNDVQPSDLVRVSYTITGQNPIMAGLDVESFPFAWGEPILERWTRVLLDPEVVTTVYRDPGVPEVIERRGKDALELTASAHKIAAVIDEGSYPREYAKLPALVISEKRGWADVVAWGVKLYPEPAPLPSDLEQRIKIWRALPDESARIGAALRAVQEEVRYFGIELGDNTHQPSEPAETWARRYGDCKDKTRLLVTVLKQMGIDATPALVSFEHGARIKQLPPSAAAFDHVIAQVRTAGATLWLDGTATQQRGAPETISPINFGWALPMQTGSAALVAVEIPKTAIDHTRVVEKFTSAANESLDLVVESDYQGNAANQLRRRLAMAGKDSVARNYADFYRRQYGDVTPEGSLEINDDDVQNRLKIVERYHLAKPWTASTGQRVLETYADAVASEVRVNGTSKRLAPYARRHPLQIEHLIELQLPASWTWESTKQSRTIKDAAMVFKFDAEQVGDIVRIERSFQSLSDQVLPKDFSQHFESSREASNYMGWRILASPPAQEAIKQRDKRMKDLMRGIIDDNASGKNKAKQEVEG